MTHNAKRTYGTGLVLTIFAIAGCDDFLTVEHPTIVDASTIDVEEDAENYSRSAFQNFVVSYGNLTLWSAFFTGELWVDDSGPASGEFARREIGPFTGADQWATLSQAIATNEEAVELLRPAGGVNFVRVLVGAGYALQTMAEVYCDGVIRGGPLLTTAEVLDLAAARFEEAVAVAATLPEPDRTRYVGAANVGLARAHLQAARHSEAAAVAAQVPDEFVFSLVTVDDPGNRERLGNAIYDQMIARGSQIVPPSYRAMADAEDPRISYDETGRRAQGGQLDLYQQLKYTSWASPYQLASKLEARYLEEEARQDPVTKLAFINERRAAGGQEPFAGGDMSALLGELMDQKSRDFWIEGAKRLGDWRRNGDLVPNILPAGAPNYEPTEPPIGVQVCFPIPATETDNNPNL